LGAFKLGLLIAALFVVAVVYDWSMLDKLIIALVALGLVAWIWSRLSLTRLGLTRSLSSDRVRAGEVVTEDLALRNYSRLPKLWVEVRDHSSLPYHRAGRVVSLRGRSGEAWTTDTRARQRGRFRLGPITVLSGDPFGIFQTKKSIPVSHELVVYPAMVDVSQIHLPAATMSGGAMHALNPAVSSPTIAGLRDYTAGDPLNRISWTATARRGMMMVKEFDPDPTSDLWIILDMSEEAQVDLPVGSDDALADDVTGAVLDSTEEYIVAIGASLADRALSQGRKVGLVVNRAMPVRLDADNSQRQWFRIFETLATANAFGTRTLTEAIAAESRRLTRTNGVVVVTASGDREWTPAARALVQRQVPVTAVVVDAGSAAKEPISPMIEDLAAARVAVTRFPTHLAMADVHEPFSVFTT
jgi:uncharacterized protein (DUF58 family)